MRSLLLSIILMGMALAAGAQQVRSANEYQRRAEEIFHRVWKLYRVPQHKLFSEYYPQHYKDSLTYMQDGNVQSKEVSYLWPLSGVVSSANIMTRLPRKKAAYLPFLDSAIMAMLQYRDTVRTPAGYQAYPVKFEQVDRYYDDNALVAIDYVEAYENTGNRQYLSHGKEVFAFIMSGWTNVLGGGVPWLEGHSDQKPACTNSMSTIAALKLYNVTKDPYYLQQGIRFYEWMNTHLRDSAGLYVNDIKTADSSLNRTYWTYNSGAMLQAAIMLYTFTKEQKYYKDAKQTAASAYHYFRQPQEKMRSEFCDLPWFVTVLFRGYAELYAVDKDPQYLKAIIARVDHAWDNRDPYGLLNHNWSDARDTAGKPKWLLDEACIAELYARMAMLNLK